jgi:chemosensory pili system protein ChpA (sensor histidine kinase/response regulator)
MVEFESLADRLYRVVRQAAKETGKQVRLDIVGGAIEIDRGVLERMAGPSSTCCATAWPTASSARARGRRQGRHRHDHASPSRRKATRWRSKCATTAPAWTWRASAAAVERGLLAADAAPSDAELAS